MTVLARHPGWVRECRDCKRLIFDPDGRPTDTPVPPGFKPPCMVCPKLDGVAEKAPLPPDRDFGGVFADLRQWWREGRAVGFPSRLDPLLRAVAALFHDADEAQGRRADRATAREELVDVLVTANILRRM